MGTPRPRAALLICAWLATPAAASTFTARGYVAAVMAASPSVRAAEKVFAQQQDVYRAAVLDAALPTASLSLSNTLYDDETRRFRLRRSETASNLSARWNLYDSTDSPYSKVRRARLDCDFARLTYLTARQSEALKALTRFYALVSAQQRVVTAQVNLTSRQRQYDDTNEQYQSGTRSKIELTTSEGDKLQSELSVAEAAAGERKALVSFNELIDAEPDAPAAVAASTRAPVALGPPAADLARALDGNYGYRQLLTSLERTRITSRLAVMGQLPALRVDASWSKSGLGLIGEPGFHGRNNPDYSLGAALTVPLGFGGIQNALRVAGAREALDAAELAQKNAARALKTTVLNAREDIALQAKSLSLLEFQVKAQREAVEELSAEYSQGGAQFLQLDTAQTKLLDSSNRLIDAANALDVAIANYRALLGDAVEEP